MILDDKTIQLIKSNSLFSDLSEAEFQLVLPLMQEATLEGNSFIFHEKDRGDYIYIIKEGEVEITKEEEEGKHYRLAILEKGSCFGEMALLAPYLRSATARALKATRVIRFSLKDLHHLAEERFDFSKIVLSLASNVAERLRSTNASVVETLKKQLQISYFQNQMGRLNIYIFILLAIYFFIYKLAIQLGPSSALTTYLTPTFVVLFGATSILFAAKSGFPPSFFGISLRRWKKYAREACLFTIPLLLLMTALKWMAISTIDEFSDLPVFSIEGISPKHFWEPVTPPSHIYIYFILYLTLVPLQEFIARGCVQSAFQNFFIGKHRKLLAIFVSNIQFCIFHGHKPFSFALFAFLTGMFWGWLYARQRTLVGPSISHIIVGMWAFLVLDLETVLCY